MVQKEIAIEMFYTGWPGNRVPDFPAAMCDAIMQKGAVPHITWEPWVSGIPSPLDGIIDGSYDAYLAGYAGQTKSWGKPLFIRVGHEMNGNWYPWCGQSNGGATTDGFGDLLKPDGPERFVAAYRKIRQIFDSVGVRNVSWVWCPNNFSTPYESWNQPELYYPGDDVVDWIGLDGYNWGASQSWSGWSSFYDTFNEIYNRFKSYPKPLMIGEFASTELGGNKGPWIRDVFFYTKLLYTRIKAITWFNINKETDWRVNSSLAALTAYQESVADPYYLSSVPVTEVHSPERELTELTFAAPSPNPSNGAVRLRVTLPQGALCALRVCNVLGQEVRTIVDGMLPAGPHEFTWDTRDQYGSDLPTGVYFALLQTNGVRSVQKIILTK